MGHFGMSQAFGNRFITGNAFNIPRQTPMSMMPPIPAAPRFGGGTQFWGGGAPVLFFGGGAPAPCPHSCSPTGEIIAGLGGFAAGAAIGALLGRKQQPPMPYYPQTGFPPYGNNYGNFGYNNTYLNQDYSANLNKLYQAKGYNIVFNQDGTYSATDKNGNNVANGLSYQQMQGVLG